MKERNNQSFWFALTVLGWVVFGLPQAIGGEIDGVRQEQLQRLTTYILDSIQPNGLVRDSLTLSPQDPPFHPATPDAAGFALLGLCAADHLELVNEADKKVEAILSAYAGRTAGVTPERSADGHWIHFMDVNTGRYEGCCWDDSYSPIGTALLVSGAQFASNHFSQNSTIGELTEELKRTTNFNAAIHPSLDGRIYLSMAEGGGGRPGEVHPWNEYMLVVSLALEEEENARARAVAPLWLVPDNLPTISFRGIETLTDNETVFAPAFWVQQQHFFNPDFANDAQFETFFENHKRADALYCSDVLDESYRYGLTAGVVPNGYSADRIFSHNFVFSPEAAAAWGDLDAVLAFQNEQPPESDPRYRYGLVRVSSSNQNWVPFDAGLVDHLFLMFGLVESIDPLFFRQRLNGPSEPPPRVVPGDCNHDRTLDLTDAVCIFRALFLGPPAQFPCGEGVNDANITLMDWQPDGQVDLSDGTSLLSFLFLGGPAHTLAVPGAELSGCVPILGCPHAPGCE